MLKNFEPADFFAFAVLGAFVFFQWRGVDAMLGSAVVLIVGYYFGKKSGQQQSNGSQT